MLFIFGFGWAKPVPVNLSNIPDRRKGLILVSSAGIVANIMLAFIALLISRLISPELAGVTAKILYILAKINIILAAFNLIPIPPLDGSKILMGVAPEGIRRILVQIEPFGFFIVIGFLYFGLLDPLINFFQWIILAIIAIFLPR
jgi:Zn-dependent protease